MPKLNPTTTAATKTPTTTKGTKAPKKPKGQTKPPTAKKKGKEEKEQRPIKHPAVKCTVCEGDAELTAEQAKKLIGWDTQNVTDSNYDLKDLDGNKVRLWNNMRNRKLDMAHVRMLMAEILEPGQDDDGNPTRSRWRQNGSPLTIGNYGGTISAQHRCVALILADQEWRKNPDLYLNWEGPPTIPCIIVYGIDEADHVVNTIDVGKPRSLSDVLYRSHFFADLPAKDREPLARHADRSITLLWERTAATTAASGLSLKKHSPQAMIEFFTRHRRLLDCVKHIYEENAGSKAQISKDYLGVGEAAAFMFLMASSTSDRAEYAANEPPVQDPLSWDLWDRANDFWVELAAGAKSMSAIREAFKALKEMTWYGDVRRIQPAERSAIIIKAWHRYRDDKPITAKDLALNWKDDPETGPYCTDQDLIGGIDVYAAEVHEPDVVEEEPTDEEKAEMEAAKAAIQQENADKKTNGKNGKPKPSAKPQPSGKAPARTAPENGKPRVGSDVIVTEPKGQPWRGTVASMGLDKGQMTATVRVANGFAGAGRTVTVPIEQVALHG